MQDFINKNPKYLELAKDGIHQLYYEYVVFLKKTLQNQLVNFNQELTIDDVKETTIEKSSIGYLLELPLINNSYPLMIHYDFSQREINYSDTFISVTINLCDSKPCSDPKLFELFSELIKLTSLEIMMTYDTKRKPNIYTNVKINTKNPYLLSFNQDESYKITKIDYQSLFLHIIELIINNNIILDKLNEKEIKQIKSLKSLKFFEK